jgi:MOSC domain-containing protein YiiM
MSMSPHVVAVARSARHTFSKNTDTAIRLLAGLGVEGDAHAGETVKHRSRVAADPTQPNLRQVHLVHAELFEELGERGFAVAPGDIGENVTTRGLALLALPTGTRLHLGGAAVVEVTGLRNPCAQLDAFQPGLMAAVLDRDAAGRLVRKAGIMGVVLVGGEVRPGDPIRVTLPPEPHRPLERV